MKNKVFIPAPDEWLFDHPELISAPLQPYSQGMACYHWLDVRLNPEEETKTGEQLNQAGTNRAQDMELLTRFAA